MQDVFQYLPGIGLALVILLTGFVFQKSVKPLNVSPNQFSSAVNNNRTVPTNQNIAPLNTVTAQTLMSNANGTASPANVPATVKAADIKTKSAVNLVEASEKVYFCGAATKKGTPCSRRVRGGGRCWQHVGQAAMMAQEKLLAGQ